MADAEPNAPPIEITVLYDNYLLCKECRADWGFSCLIAGTAKTILFDAGTHGNILLGNMDTLQVNAGDVELVVISHDHLDHTGGLAAFLSRRSEIPVYLPKSVSSGLVQSVETYGASVVIPEGPLEICERVHLTGPMTGAVVEQSLVLDTPKGLVIITGCAHPGVVQIIRKAKDMLGKDVYLILGGFHLLNMSDSQVQEIIQQFRDLGVRKAGPSHCTGPRAIELFRQAYGADFVPVGVGRISMPVECDFTGDWRVDIEDLILFIEHWGQADPTFDIAPPLFGDGIVDVLDLEALMAYWGQEIPDPTLVAHWKLDEVEGATASDSAGDNDGTLYGEPTWRPAGGELGGALELDGVNNYVETGFAINPSEGPFSVFAWVKEGAPGHVILSQAGGANWLMAAPDGALMTELKGSGRTGKPLASAVDITDGAWHRVGFTWDGANRILYADDLEVARDAQTSLAGSTGGLCIGAGKSLETGTFWSGLIDDVRIYNRVVEP
jgi:7,8-dihydropterin-6-yl-methyl-4-(beta-D-ribofuranosyl)aminobenzene 5'-phosphate synthase